MKHVKNIFYEPFVEDKYTVPSEQTTYDYLNGKRELKAKLRK